MTSKEALEQLKCDLISTQCELFKDNCYDERILAVYQLDCLNLIKQDLERLEMLEKDIITTYEFNKELREENAKLKNAIEILKEKLDISFYNYKVNNEDIYEIMINGVLKGYTQEEYNLLKKVLSND